MKPDIDQIMNTPDEAIFTPQDCARMLGCSAQAIRRNIKEGKLKAVCIMGKWYMTGKGLKKLVVFT